jgi:tetratricopeptide (TPR) repeat protein
MFLSPEEKLLAFRKKHKITQGELVGEDITRVFLGMIEIGKRSLTEKTAKLLCKNFNRILKERGIKDSIKVEELMKTKEQQAIEFFKDILKRDNISSKEIIWDIEEALYEINDADRVNYCLQLFEKFFSLKEYRVARNYLLKSMHRVKDIESIKESLLKIFELNKILCDYEGSVFAYRRFKNKLEKEKWCEILENILFNYSYALIKCGEYKEAFENLQLLIKKSKNDKFLFETRKLLGKAYKKMGDYSHATSEFISLAKGKTPQDKAEAYSNMIEIALETDDILLLKKFYEKCKINYEADRIQDEKLNFEILIWLGKGAKKLQKNKDSKAFFMEALMVGKSNNYSVEKRMEIISELFQIFEKSDFFSVQSIENEYFGLLLDEKNYKPGIRILEYYYKTLPSELENKFKMFK